MIKERIENEDLEQILKENPQFNDYDEKFETLEDLVNYIDWDVDLIHKDEFTYQILEQIRANTIYSKEELSKSEYIDIPNIQSVEDLNGVYAGYVSSKPIKLNNQDIYIYRNEDGDFFSINDIVSFEYNYNDENDLIGLNNPYTDDWGKYLINSVVEDFKITQEASRDLAYIEDGELLDKYNDLAHDYAIEKGIMKICEKRGVRRDTFPGEFDYENKWSELLAPNYGGGTLSREIQYVEEQYEIEIDEDIFDFYESEIFPMVMGVKSEFDCCFDKYLEVWGNGRISLKDIKVVDFPYLDEKTLECWCDNDTDFILDVKRCLFEDVEEENISNDTIPKEDFIQELKDFWNNASDEDKRQFQKNVKDLKNDIEVLDNYPLGDFYTLDNFYWNLADKINDKLETQLDQDVDKPKKKQKM